MDSFSSEDAAFSGIVVRLQKMAFVDDPLHQEFTGRLPEWTWGTGDCFGPLDPKPLPHVFIRPRPLILTEAEKQALRAIQDRIRLLDQEPHA